MSDPASQDRTELFEPVIEASPDPIVVFAEDSTIRLWNPAAEDTFGYAAAEVVGRRFTDLDVLPPEAVGAFEGRLGRAFGGERFDGVEVQRFTKGGERLHLSLSKAPVRAPDGSVTGVVTVKKDVSEQKRLETRLREENRRLDEFASIVSHDLRNPLAAATSGLELARNGGEEEYFEVVEEAHARMAELIEDLLAIAREGVAEDDLERVDLAEVAEGCWGGIEDGATTLTVRVEPDLVAHRGGLERIVENLLQNAVDHGGDNVLVGGLEDGSGFFVEDDGHGVPVDQQGDVFEDGYTTGRDGNGYGLPIVREVAAAHGWEVDLTTGEDGGARFEISGVTTDG